MNSKQNRNIVHLALSLVLALAMYNLLVTGADNSYSIEDDNARVLYLSSLQFFIPISLYAFGLALAITAAYINRLRKRSRIAIIGTAAVYAIPVSVTALVFLIDYLLPSSDLAARDYATTLYNLQGIHDSADVDAMANMSFIQQSWVGLMLSSIVFVIVYLIMGRVYTNRKPSIS